MVVASLERSGYTSAALNGLRGAMSLPWRVAIGVLPRLTVGEVHTSVKQMANARLIT